MMYMSHLKYILLSGLIMNVCPSTAKLQICFTIFAIARGFIFPQRVTRWGGAVGNSYLQVITLSYCTSQLSFVGFQVQYTVVVRLRII